MFQEERFEHEGLVFETSNTNQYHQRRREEGGEGNYDGNSNNKYEEEYSSTTYRGRGSRGRGISRGEHRGPTQDEQIRGASWRDSSMVGLSLSIQVYFLI